MVEGSARSFVREREADTTLRARGEKQRAEERRMDAHAPKMLLPRALCWFTCRLTARSGVSLRQREAADEGGAGAGAGAGACE